MAPKITQAQLNANQEVYKVDDFRQMVNYTSGTNKGYVRFSLGQDGKLKLEKFNNKVDVPLSWRSNTKAEHNTAMRAKFAEALRHDLKYANDYTFNKIKDKILLPKDANDRLQEGKALSRRDIKAVFEDFDKAFNSPGGRRTILFNFFQKAMEQCGFKGDQETFKQDFLKLETHGLDYDALNEYCQDVEGEGAQRDRMVKNEGQFRSLLVHLESLVDAAKMRVQIDASIKGLVSAALEKGDSFGLNIANQGGGKFVSDLRAGLIGLLNPKGVENFGGYINTFIDKVFPFYLQDGIANVRDYAGGDKSKEPEAIAANFDFEELVKLAAEFIKEADAATKAAAAPKPLTDKDYGVLQGLMERVLDAKANNEINKLVSSTVMKNANVTAAQAKDFGAKVVSMRELFSSEAAVDNCAARFVLKHFARGAENMIQQDATEVDKVKEFLQEKLVPALQLQYGERWSDGNGHYMQNGGVPKFIQQLTGHMQSVIDNVGGGKTLYGKLFSYTLPNIINQRIDDSIKNKDRMHFEGGELGGLDFAAKQINRVARAYRDFTTGKASALAEKAIAGFNKMLARQEKKGNITADEHVALLGDFRAQMKTAITRAIDRYFQAKPPEEMSDDIEKDVKAEVQRLVKFFNEEKSAVISEMSRRLNTAILSHSIGGGAQGVKAKREVIDAAKAVNDFLGTLSNRQPPLDNKLKGPALNRGLEKLYLQTLDKMLQNRKVSKDPIDTKFLEDVQKAFAKAANDHIEKAEKFAKNLDDAVRKHVNKLVNDLIAPDDKLRDYVSLSKDDRKALVDALTADAMLAEHGHIVSLKERFLENPGEAGYESAEKVVARETGKDNALEGLRSSVLRAGRERILSAAAWLENKDEQGLTFEDRLLVDEKQRLKKANPGISDDEIANIAKEQTHAIIKRAKDFVILYTIGESKGFAERIGKELAKSSDARMKDYTAFRNEFLRLAQTSLDNCSSLGKEKLDSALATVLEEASRTNPLQDVKVLANAFDKMLTDMVNGIIDKKFDEYVAYSKAYTEAFENSNPVLNNKIESRIAELKNAGASDDDVAFFRKSIVPHLRDLMEYEIADKPEDWLGQNGRDKAAKLFDDIFNTILRDVSDYKFDPSDKDGFEKNLRNSLEDIGFGEFMDDPATSAAVKENVTTWLKGDDVQGILTNMRRAMMTIRIYGRYSQDAAAVKAREAMRAYNDSLYAAVTGIKSQILMQDFNAKELKPVLKLFELWLEQYDLPTLEIGRGSGGVTTLKEMAMEHFTERVKYLQNRIATDPNFKEPLLSKEYLDSFLRFINDRGISVMMLEMKQTVKTRLMERIAASGSADLFDVEKARTKGEPDYVIKATTVNMLALNNLFDANMEIVEKEMRADIPTVESLQRWRLNIENRFTTHMRNLNSLKHSCDTRVTHLRQLDSLTTKMRTLINDAILKRFGGEDIATSGKLSANTKTGALNLFADIVNTFSKLLADQTMKFRQKALAFVKNPLDTPPTFLTDRPSDDYLTQEFKALADSCVKGVCGLKKFTGIVKQIDKELKIKK